MLRHRVFTTIVSLPLAVAGCQSTAVDPASNMVGYPIDFPQLTCAAYGNAGGGNAKLTANRYRPGDPAYIEFRTRTENLIGSGHTYVVFGRLDKDGKPATRQFIGLFPKGGLIGMYAGTAVPIEAQITPRREDCTGSSIDAFRVSLTEGQYAELKGKVAGVLANPPLWHLIANNCNHFAAQLGRVAGLKPVEAFLLPAKQYIKAYAQRNGVSGA